jgi:hypothetical protein
MKKLFLILLFFLFRFSEIINAQIPFSWSIDSTQGVLTYESEAIYFKRPNGILKSDYDGNEIWARQIPFIIKHFSVDDNSIVCLDDSCVYRLDTSGNILWARSLSSFVCPGVIISNTLGAVTVSDNYIYVSVYQYNLGNYQSYNSMVVFDTLGNTINSWCDTPMNSHNDIPVSSFKSLQNGAWVLRTYSTGLHRGVTIVKTDSIGNMDNNANVISSGWETYVTYGDIIPLADSNYFTFNNFYNDLWDIGQQAVCIKFNEQGNVLWVDSIRSTGQIQGLGYMTEIQSVASDDSSNIYLYGWSLDDNDSSRNVVIKLSPTGNLVYCKAWIDQGLVDIHYHNGFIYSGGGSKIFDTSFFSPCYATDTTIGVIFNSPSIQSSGGTFSYPIINYVPANLPTPVSNPLSPSLRHDLCIQNGIINEDADRSILIFPNPASTEVHISIQRSSTEKNHLDIFNQIGTKVYSEDISSTSFSIDCSSFAKGIYFVKLQCSDYSTVEKLIVE